MSSGRFTLNDLRVSVESIGGRSVCGMRVGDHFELSRSSAITIPAGKHFCAFAMASVLPFLAAKQRTLDPADWLAADHRFACPDPDEKLVMRIELVGTSELHTDDVT